MSVLDRLRGRLVVSVQAEPGSLLGTPATIALLARVCERNGAAGVRIEGEANLRAVRAAVAIPIIGLIKRRHAGFEPYITTTLAEVREIAEAGADVVAFDATARARPDGSSVRAAVETAHAAGCLAMADCSTAEDGAVAAGAGSDVVATTLAGYTAESHGRSLPALDVVARLHGAHPFVVCEGGIDAPDAARAAFAAGASAVVVGTAITNLDALVRRFAGAVRQEAEPP